MGVLGWAKLLARRDGERLSALRGLSSPHLEGGVLGLVKVPRDT